MCDGATASSTTGRSKTERLAAGQPPSEYAVDLNRLDDVLERFPAETFQAETIPRAPHGFGTGENLARLHGFDAGAKQAELG